MFQIENLDFKIGGSQILNQISLQVSKGETVGVIGPNGSGKTTLFNSISGFNLPNAGRITFNEADITNMKPFERAKLGIGRVFQNFAIFREMTVIENIITALEGRCSVFQTILPWSATNKSNREKALGYLTQVGLQEKAAKKAGSLSGGQLRLLEIVRAFAFGADLFLLDEPTAGVSPKMKEDVINLIRFLITEGKTIMVIEHDLSFIQKFCNRIIVLNAGRVVLDNTPEIVRADPMLQEIYFGK